MVIYALALMVLLFIIYFYYYYYTCQTCLNKNNYHVANILFIVYFNSLFYCVLIVCPQG